MCTVIKKSLKIEKKKTENACRSKRGTYSTNQVKYTRIK